jgi:3-oxoadipate enol-lactonase
MVSAVKHQRPFEYTKCIKRLQSDFDHQSQQGGKMKTININGASVAYQVDGSGPGLVLVHGTGGNSQTNWGHMVNHFTPYRTLVRPDYAGSGETVDPEEHLTIERLAEQVVATAEDAGTVPFDLVGYSLGACVAAYIAATSPHLVRSLVLVAGMASGKDSRAQLQFDLWATMIKTDRRAFAQLLTLTGFSPDFFKKMTTAFIEQSVTLSVNTNNWEGMLKQTELDKRIDIQDILPQITCPTLVIGCTHDQMVPVAHSKALAASISNARYEELPTGHLVPFETPDKLAKLILDFVGR